jgi:dipeptidyl aminopeptidase/acylaminoacyl peptidase
VNLILEHAQAAVEFVRKDLVSLLESRIDPEKLALTGGSAGGWLGELSIKKNRFIQHGPHEG